MKNDIDRRTFFKRATGIGALIAVSQLPSLAEDNPTVFPKRGQYERLALAFATIEVGLKKPFSVLHISDTHLTAAYPHESDKKQKLKENRTQCFGGRQEEALRDSLNWAKDHVDYIIHTGDLIDWQSEANFDLVRKYFGDKMYGCLGNHEYSVDMWLSEPKQENTESYKDLSREIIQKAYPFDISFQSQVVNGVNFITIDNVYGTVTPQQIEQFYEETKKKLPIVLCMHVPYYSDQIWRASEMFWENIFTSDINDKVYAPNDDCKAQREDPTTCEFFSYLKKEPLLKAILSGHLHVTVEEQFSPSARQYVVGSNFLFHGREILFI